MTDGQGRIMRIFRGYPVDGAAAAQFEANSLTTSIAAVKAHDGLIAFYVLRPTDPSNGWLFVSLWESEEAIRGYAGHDWTSAVLPPGYADLLTSVEMEHYHVLGAGWAPPGTAERL